MWTEIVLWLMIGGLLCFMLNQVIWDTVHLLKGRKKRMDLPFEPGSDKKAEVVDTAQAERLMVLADALADKAMDRDRERERLKVARERRRDDKHARRMKYLREQVQYLEVLRYAAGMGLVSLGFLLCVGAAAACFSLGVFFLIAVLRWDAKT